MTDIFTTIFGIFPRARSGGTKNKTRRREKSHERKKVTTKIKNFPRVRNGGTKIAPRKESPTMKKGNCGNIKDEDLKVIGYLVQISVVAKRAAKERIRAICDRKEGGDNHGKSGRPAGYRRPAKRHR